MPNASVLPAYSSLKGTSIEVSHPSIRVLWILFVSTTVAVETIPIPLMPPVGFYSYCAAKLICFFAVGYLAPLAFWRFNALNRGILLAAASATAVETLQGFVQHGHSFHWYELVLKLVVISLGFALALDARYEGEIVLGRLRIGLEAGRDEA